MKLRTIKQLKKLAGKRVLVRIDANAPIKNGKILDDYKLIKTLPTIKYLLAHQVQVILVSHLGRPHGYDKKLSLRPVAKYLEKKLRQPILFWDFIKDPSLNSFSSPIFAPTREHTPRPPRGGIVSSPRILKPGGEIMMLENIRFDEDEEKNTGTLAEKLSKLADVFVFDGFGVAHRDSASVTGVARYLPAYAGLLLEAEVTSLDNIMHHPRRPLVLALGGAKMETKIPLIKNFINRADYILLGGGIVATYLWHQGCDVGASLVEKELPEELFKLFKNKKIIVPVDVTVGTVKGKNATTASLDVPKFIIQNPNLGIYDVGPQTLKMYGAILKKAQSIIWNGGLGYFEQKPYNKGTETLVKYIVRETRRGAFSVCGGGETEQLLRKLKKDKKISLVSTGGGAMLEFLSGKKMPGIEIVLKK